MVLGRVAEQRCKMNETEKTQSSGMLSKFKQIKMLRVASQRSDCRVVRELASKLYQPAMVQGCSAPTCLAQCLSCKPSGLALLEKGFHSQCTCLPGPFFLFLKAGCCGLVGPVDPAEAPPVSANISLLSPVSFFPCASVPAVDALCLG